MNELDNITIDKKSFAYLDLLSQSDNVPLKVGTATAAAHAVRLDQLQAYTYSGTYTPTVSDTTNVAANTPYLIQYARTGNYVQVSGTIDIDPTATGQVIFLMNLPVASDIGAISDIGGTMSADGTGIIDAGLVFGGITNNGAIFSYYATNAANHSVCFTFGYRVI